MWYPYLNTRYATDTHITHIKYLINLVLTKYLTSLNNLILKTNKFNAFNVFENSFILKIYINKKIGTILISSLQGKFFRVFMPQIHISFTFL